MDCPPSELQCKFCSRSYKSKGGLSKHVKIHHPEERENGNVECGQCKARLMSMKGLILHMQKSHNCHVATSTLSFESIAAFLAWKKHVEAETNSFYVQNCAPHETQSSRRWYYYCNRSGKYKPKGEGIRNMKSQGSNKIGATCLAHIKAVEEQTTGKISVFYCETHTHPVQIGHLPLPEETRLLVAQKLKSGVSIDKVLDVIRDELPGETATRKNIITKQDIRNINRQYNVNGIQKHKDDQISVCAWVKELQSLVTTSCPIIAFKPQGREMDGPLEKNDFMLAIQTEPQRRLLTTLGNNIVCMDATHSTNQYDFNLVTILVLDEYGEGVPVAWLISNKEDGVTLCEFLRAVLHATGNLYPKYFMSDDAEQYYSSWVNVFGGNPIKLLCSWHVHRAWRKHLASIDSNEKKVEVYHKLCTVMQALSESDFRKMMQSFITWMLADSQLLSFCEYFQKYYAGRVEQWAYCFRIGTPANTNMSTEAFHRLLKSVYFEGKQNRRIDHLLSILLRIARDKVYERLIKGEKGKITH